ESANMIFLNDRRQVLLFLRDDLPTIPFPNVWCLPGGHLEPGETPKDCIVREMQEELSMACHDALWFATASRRYGVEHTFWMRANFAVDGIHLTEGQRVEWYTQAEIAEMRLGYEDNGIVEEFFATCCAP